MYRDISMKVSEEYEFLIPSVQVNSPTVTVSNPQTSVGPNAAYIRWATFEYSNFPRFIFWCQEIRLTFFETESLGMLLWTPAAIITSFSTTLLVLLFENSKTQTSLAIRTQLPGSLPTNFLRRHLSTPPCSSAAHTTLTAHPSQFLTQHLLLPLLRSGMTMPQVCSSWIFDWFLSGIVRISWKYNGPSGCPTSVYSPPSNPFDSLDLESEIAALTGAILTIVIISSIVGFCLYCVLPIAIIICCCLGIIGGTAAAASQ